jgi:nitroreductase
MGFRWIRQILKSLRQFTILFDPVVLAGTLFGYAALWRAGFDANHRLLVLLVATVMGRAAVWFISRRGCRPKA